MSYTTIYFLAKADNFDKAENGVSAYLDTEHFFDCYDVLPESSGSLKEKRIELLEFIKNWDWEKQADVFLNLAEKEKAEGNISLFGRYLIDAGVLYSQSLSIDTYVFNINEGSYSIPKADKDWWAIAIKFHY